MSQMFLAGRTAKDIRVDGESSSDVDGVQGTGAVGIELPQSERQEEL